MLPNSGIFFDSLPLPDIPFPALFLYPNIHSSMPFLSAAPLHLLKRYHQCKLAYHETLINIHRFWQNGTVMKNTVYLGKSIAVKVQLNGIILN